VQSLFAGPIFGREAMTAPRTTRHYIARGVYIATLGVLICTAWTVVTGAQDIRTISDMARFGSVLFQVLAILQLAVMMFLAATSSASIVAQEKDKRTLILLLMTHMTNRELVAGKFAASYLHVLSLVVAGLPVFAIVMLLGGVSPGQVVAMTAVTLGSSLLAAAIGNFIAFWREKTFQSLSMTFLLIVIWIGVSEAIAAGAFGERWAVVSTSVVGNAISPLRAMLMAAKPSVSVGGSWETLLKGVFPFLGFSISLSLILIITAILRVRIWNPSPELFQVPKEYEESSIFSHSAEGKKEAELGIAAETEKDEVARAGHVDARIRVQKRYGRTVWQNPVLWREMRTWAYGRKVLIIRLGYLLFFALAVAALVFLSSEPIDRTALLPREGQPIAPLLLVSFCIVNALAVTAITSERDGKSLELLMVTDLLPREFLLGKLLGVLYVTKEMVVLPLLIGFGLWWIKRIGVQDLCFLEIGLLVMYVFSAMLGIHCGTIYSSSRTAVTFSLGTVFFLFLGVATCILILVSFSGSFEAQLPSFLSFILGGSVGLYAVLGIRNPSPAILAAALLLPFATFFAFTSFLIGNQTLQVFVVTSGVYGFTALAMMVPALSEYDIAMGRSRQAEDE
jgi:ABC-type Na+ efflux pump permease subunit